MFRYRLKRDIYRIVDEIENGQEDESVAARKSLRDHLTAIAPVFAAKPFFMSEDYSLVDCFLAPVLWRLPSYNIHLPSGAQALLQYGERLFERDAFEASLTEPEREMRE